LTDLGQAIILMFMGAVVIVLCHLVADAVGR
jgi:hypothetical protein